MGRMLNVRLDIWQKLEPEIHIRPDTRYKNDRISDQAGYPVHASGRCNITLALIQWEGRSSTRDPVQRRDILGSFVRANS